jgi:hypothetical protein
LAKLTLLLGGMADGGLLLVFRALTTADLQKRQKELLKHLGTTLSSQTVGSKSFTRDLREIRALLEAITFVLNERGLPGNYDSTIITDFSEIGRAPPGGTIDQPL